MIKNPREIQSNYKAVLMGGRRNFVIAYVSIFMVL